MGILAVSGKYGRFYINGIQLNVDKVRWQIENNIQETPSFGGGDWMEHTNGKTKGTCTCSGTWDALYNPNANWKAGRKVAIVVQIASSPLIEAGAASAWVQSWDGGSDADGLADWQAVFVFEGAFNDFSGGPAAP